MVRGLSGRARGRSSERIAERLLESLGYTVIERHKRIIMGGVEVGEVDIIARGPEGTGYAVEVKAGRLDVSGVRQAYTNALLLNLKPMVVCKGYADDAARKLAEELGVKVIETGDYYLVSAEELEVIVSEAVSRVIDSYMTALIAPTIRLTPEEYALLEAVATSYTPSDAARSLGIRVQDLMSRISEMIAKGRLPPKARNYRFLRRWALVTLSSMRIKSYVEAVINELRELKKVLAELNK